MLLARDGLRRDLVSRLLKLLTVSNDRLRELLKVFLELLVLLVVVLGVLRCRPFEFICGIFNSVHWVP